jgi:hypothetical protein
MSIGDDERVVAIEPIGESRDGAALEGDDPAEDSGQEPGDSLPPADNGTPPESTSQGPDDGGQEDA